MPTWLTIVLCIPVGLFLLGVVLLALGDMNPPSEADGVQGPLQLIAAYTVIGLVATVLFGIISVPGLILWRVLGWNTQLAFGVGTPVGVVLMFVLVLGWANHSTKKEGADGR